MNTQLNTAEYYRNREQQERATAASSTNPAIAKIHLEFAERYAGLINEAIKAEEDAARAHPASVPPPRLRLNLSL